MAGTVFENILSGLGWFLPALLLTILIELPVIRISGVCKKNAYIVLVNVLTNVTLNLVLLVIRAYAPNAEMPVTIASEAVLIPVAESLLYIQVSDRSKGKVFLFTYIANIASYFLGGLILTLILKSFGGSF